jgi:hypothetical protein
MSRMLEEIRQQPERLERTLRNELKRVERFKRLIGKRRPTLIVLVARGTSDNAALFGRYLLEITTRIPVSLAAPSICTLYNTQVNFREALVVAISQSGESTDTNLVLSEARRQGALTVGITNEASSSMTKLAQHVFLVHAGKEKSVAATKTYTGQVLMLYLLAYALGARIRPDMTVRLPSGRTLVVDAKVPLTAYLDAVSATDDTARRTALNRHSQQVAEHVRQLASKQYWNQFQPAPELVVLFLPGDHFFSAALEAHPDLIEEALARKVVIATPVTLISVLKGIAFGWNQEQLAENAEEIRRVASELYERVQTVHDYYAETGRQLEKTVESYNRSVGSWDARLLPALRKMRELGVPTGDEPEAPEQIDLLARRPRAVGGF